LPLEFEEIVTQLALLAAVQSHSAGVDMFTLPIPPSDEKPAVAGAIEYEHWGVACDAQYRPPFVSLTPNTIISVPVQTAV